MRSTHGLHQAAFAIAVALLLSACTSDPSAVRTQQLAAGDARFQQGDYGVAVIEYQKAAEADPASGEARQKLAESLLRIGAVAPAASQYREAASRLPDNVDVQMQAGRLALVRGRYEEAASFARRALELDPNRGDAHILVGNALAGLQNLDDALAQMTEAAALDPTDARAHRQVGRLAMARGDVAQAEAAFKRAVDLDTSAIPRIALARFYRAAGRDADAETWFKSAVQAEPDNLDANRALARFYLSSQRPTAAEVPLRTLAERVDTPDAWLELSDYYIALRQESKAIPILQRLADSSVGYVESRLRLATIDHVAGRRKEAHQWLDEILKWQPTNAKALLLKGRLFRAEGQYDEAIVRVRLAANAEPRSIVSRQELAALYVLRHNLDEAVRSLTEVIDLNPEAVESRAELSRILLSRGEIDRARTLADEALALRPDHLLSLLARTHALLAAGEMRAARETIEKARSAAATPAPFEAGRLALVEGLLLVKEGQAAKGRGVLERAAAAPEVRDEALSALVDLDLAEERGGAALSMISARIARDPEDAVLYRLSSRVKAARGQVDAAERDLDAAIAAEPDDVESYLALGDLWKSNGRIAEARGPYEEAARRQPGYAAAQLRLADALDAMKLTQQANEVRERLAARTAERP